MFKSYANKEEARKAWSAQVKYGPTEGYRAEAPKVIKAGAGIPEIRIYGEIGPWGILAKDVLEALDGLAGAPTFNVRINCIGGDAFEGLAIYSALCAHPAKVNCIVEGVAASAGSIIAMAGDTVSIDDNAFFMIHRAWCLCAGNALEMLDTASTLEKIDSRLAGIYASKTKKTPAQCMALMTGSVDGTWFDSTEAIAEGFCDKPSNAPGEPANEIERPASNLAAYNRTWDMERVKLRQRQLEYAA